MTTLRPALAAVALLATLGCAELPSAVRRALGGSSDFALPTASTLPTAFTREVEARVHYGFPGRWRWVLAYVAPDRFRMSIETTGAVQHFVFDGSALESWVGGARVGRDVGDGEAYASIGRWLGVTSLAALPAAAPRWQDAGGDPLFAGAPHVLSFRFPGGGEAYWLGFDDAGHVVAARGPIEIPGIGAGRLEARFDDFRPVAGWEVPFVARYRLNGEPFFEERLVRFEPEAQLDPR